MLDKLLHRHIDKMDELEASVIADIDKAMAAIDIRLLIADPHSVMMDTVEMIRHQILTKYAKEATRAGFDLARDIEELDRNILIDPSKDPEKNKDIVDVRDNG